MRATTLLRVTTDDGVALAIHRLGPQQGPRVLLVSGTFSNATFWLGTRGTGFARYLANEGCDVYVLEPRGHGESARPDRTQRWNFDDWIRRDIPAALRSCTSHNESVVLIGHSAGGAAIIAALAADPSLQKIVRGIVIVATPLPWLQYWRGMFARAIRAVSRRVNWFPSKALGLGPEDELAGVMAQWMTWNIDAKWVGDDGTDYGARFADVTVPMLVIAAAGDHIWAPPAACHALFELAGSANKTFMVCGKESGFTHDFDHVEILVAKAARSEVWPIIGKWLSALPEGLIGKA
ncbi:MAG: alpha/beta fold hydrolase [Longimicrobiales bacterium]